MRPTEEQRRAMAESIASHQHVIWRIRNAMKGGDPRFNEMHPDNLRKEIRRLQSLLQEALA